MNFSGFSHGMGIGGWLTNYKRFNVLPQERRMVLSPGDFEHFETYITRRDIDYIASLEMDHIRLGFDQLVVEESHGVCRERVMALIDRFCGWCRDAGVNIVLNMHKAIGNYCDIAEERQLLDDVELQARFIAVWVEFEKRYAGRPEIVFELLNEVRDVPPELWNHLAARTIAALHEINPGRRVIIGSTCWNSPSTLDKLADFGPLAAYAWHIYEPAEFTHQQGVLHPLALYYNRRMPYPGPIDRYRDFQSFVNGNPNAYPGLGRMDIGYLREVMSPAFEFAATHPDRTVWCGEFGTIRHCPREWRENYMRDVIRLLLEHNIPYCVWNYLSTPNDGNRFSLVDDESRLILSPELARIIAGKL